MNQRLQIFFPGKLVFGNGCFSQLVNEVLQLFRRGFLSPPLNPYADSDWQYSQFVLSKTSNGKSSFIQQLEIKQAQLK